MTILNLTPKTKARAVLWEGKITDEVREICNNFSLSIGGDGSLGIRVNGQYDILVDFGEYIANTMGELEVLTPKQLATRYDKE